MSHRPASIELGEAPHSLAVRHAYINTYLRNMMAPRTPWYCDLCRDIHLPSELCQWRELERRAVEREP